MYSIFNMGVRIAEFQPHPRPVSACRSPRERATGNKDQLYQRMIEERVKNAVIGYSRSLNGY